MKPSLTTTLICCVLIPSAVAQTPRTPAKTVSVTGTYMYVLNSLEVLQLPDHKVRISFAGVYPNSKRRAETRNVGTFDETVPFVDRSATVKLQYQQDPCTITLKFRSNKVIVEQGGSLRSCGFGFNVEAEGTYLKTSSKPPNFRP